MKYETYIRRGSSVKIPIPETWKDYMTMVKSDEYRRSGTTPSSSSLLFNAFKSPFSSESFLVWLRLSNIPGCISYLFRFLHKKAGMRLKIEIPRKTKIGFGFYIGHGMCMVINEQTIIGNNVNVSQFLNIGTNHSTPAIIADNVYIGPSVCIVEDVLISSCATIGAGAVVSKDIPENATAAGVPAKILNFDNPGRYIDKRYEI